MAHIESCVDTIAALATPIGEGALGIVRMSGPRCVEIVDGIFVAACGQPVSRMKTFHSRYGWIVRQKKENDQSGSGAKRPEADIVDEVLVSLMRGPRSYTREDIVEISAHGGAVAALSVLELVLERGARLAEPGEFTKRAFLNGRLDLSQAEAVMDIIQAKGQMQLVAGMRQLSGDISGFIGSLRRDLLSVLTPVEAAIDFSQEPVDFLRQEDLAPPLERMAARISEILLAHDRARCIRHGAAVVIVGRPNVGKSSLLNAILRRERAIVTAIAGTTRDTLEETISMKGMTVRLVDTAGILEPRDEVESQAVRRSREAIAGSDLVVFVVDGSEGITDEDKELFSQVQHGKHVVVYNKSDLRIKNIDSDARLSDQTPVIVSAKLGLGIAELEERIFDRVLEGFSPVAGAVLVANARHLGLLKKAQEAIEASIRSVRRSVSVEFVAEDLRLAYRALGEITGEDFDPHVLEEIFSRFCIGK